jgi:hypothetical protein
MENEGTKLADFWEVSLLFNRYAGNRGLFLTG